MNTTIQSKMRSPQRTRSRSPTMTSSRSSFHHQNQHQPSGPLPASRWAARKVPTTVIGPLHHGACTISGDTEDGFVCVRSDSSDGKRLANVARLQVLAGMSAAASSNSNNSGARVCAMCTVPSSSVSSSSSAAEVWLAWSNGKVSILNESANKVLAVMPSIAAVHGAIVSMVCFFTASTKRSSGPPPSSWSSSSSPHAPADGGWLFARSPLSRAAVLVVTASGTMLCIDARTRALMFRIPPVQTPRSSLVRCAVALGDDTRALVVLATEDCLVHIVELTVRAAQSSSTSSRTISPSASSSSSIAAGTTSRNNNNNNNNNNNTSTPHCVPRVVQVLNVAPPHVAVDLECTPLCISTSTTFLRDPTPIVFVGFLTGHAAFIRLVSTRVRDTLGLGVSVGQPPYVKEEFMALYSAQTSMCAVNGHSSSDDPVLAIVPIHHGAGCITVGSQTACVFQIDASGESASLSSSSAAAAGGTAVASWNVIQRVLDFHPEAFPTGAAALASNEVVLCLSDGGMRRLLVANPEPAEFNDGIIGGNYPTRNGAGARAGGTTSPSYVSPVSGDRSNRNSFGASAGGGNNNNNNNLSSFVGGAQHSDEDRAKLQEQDFFPLESPSMDRQQRSGSHLPQPTPRGGRSGGGGAAADNAGAGHGFWGSPSRQQHQQQQQQQQQQTNNSNNNTQQQQPIITSMSPGRLAVRDRDTLMPYRESDFTFPSTLDHAMYLADCVHRHFAAEEHERSRVKADYDHDLGWLWHLHLSALGQGNSYDIKKQNDVLEQVALLTAEQDTRREMILREYVSDMQTLAMRHAGGCRRAELCRSERRDRRTMVRDEDEQYHLMLYLWSMSRPFFISSSSSSSGASASASRQRMMTAYDEDDYRHQQQSSSSSMHMKNLLSSEMDRQLTRERQKLESVTRENLALSDTIETLQTLLKEEQQRTALLSEEVSQQSTKQSRSQMQQIRDLEKQLLLEQQKRQQRAVSPSSGRPTTPTRQQQVASATKNTGHLRQAAVQANMMSTLLQQEEEAATAASQAQLARDLQDEKQNHKIALAQQTKELTDLRQALQSEKMMREDAERALGVVKKRLDSVTSVAAQCEGDTRQQRIIAEASNERLRLTQSELEETKQSLASALERAEKAEKLATKLGAEFDRRESEFLQATNDRDAALRTSDEAVTLVEEQSVTLRRLSASNDMLQRASRKLLALCDIAVSVGNEPPAFASLRKFVRDLQLDLSALRRLDSVPTPVADRMGEMHDKVTLVQEQLFGNVQNPSLVVMDKAETVGVVTELRYALEGGGSSRMPSASRAGSYH